MKKVRTGLNAYPGKAEITVLCFWRFCLGGLLLLWHIPFLWLPDIPEMLIAGKEREFWGSFMKQETWNPAAFETEVVDEWIDCLEAPGGLKGVLSSYRATLKNGEINNRLRSEKLTIPVIAIGAKEFMGGMFHDRSNPASRHPCGLLFLSSVVTALLLKLLRDWLMNSYNFL